VIYVIDGSNLLGQMGESRQSDEVKRDLVRELSRFSHSVKKKIVCYFDGAAAPAFARSLGGVTVEFSGGESADARILKRIRASREETTLVTSDQGLAAGARGRLVTLLSCAEFRAMVVRAAESESAPAGDPADWERYFSDPKNRTEF